MLSQFVWHPSSVSRYDQIEIGGHQTVNRTKENNKVHSLINRIQGKWTSIKKKKIKEMTSYAISSDVSASVINFSCSPKKFWGSI
jgi:hypothetical protein